MCWSVSLPDDVEFGNSFLLFVVDFLPLLYLRFSYINFDILNHLSVSLLPLGLALFVCELSKWHCDRVLEERDHLFVADVQAKDERVIIEEESNFRYVG